MYNDKIFLLTWKSKKGFVYDKNTFDRLKSEIIILGKKAEKIDNQIKKKVNKLWLNH